MGERGKSPGPIGPTDFWKLSRIVRLSAQVAERMEAHGHIDLARRLRDAGQIVAEVDTALATDTSHD